MPTRSWKEKAAFTVAVGVPLSVAALADPAAAQPEAADQADYENLQEQSSFADDSFSIEVDGDADNHAALDEVEPLQNDATEADVDSYVFGSYDTAGIDVAWTETENGRQLSEETIAARRNFFVPDETGQPEELDPWAIELLETRNIDPAHAYTLKPGTYGYQSSLNAADALEEVGQSEKAENLREYLENDQLTGYFYKSGGLSAGGSMVDHAVVYTARPSAQVADASAHESTHIDQFETAQPPSEIEAYATGIVAGNQFAGTPERIPLEVESASALMTVAEPQYQGFDVDDIESLLAAEVLELLPDDLPDDWDQAKTDLESQIIHRMFDENEMRLVLELPDDAALSYKREADGSLTTQTDAFGELNLRLNPNGSITAGTKVSDDRFLEIHTYRGQRIGHSVTDNNQRVTMTVDYLGRWKNFDFENGTSTQEQFPLGMKAYSLTAKPDGTTEFRILDDDTFP